MKTNIVAPFTFAYVEKLLRRKNFGVLTSITPEGKPHSIGVVYAVSPSTEPFCIYVITRPVLKKARNIQNNLNISFVVPFPHYIFRIIPPACIQFQGKARLVPIDNPIALKAFQNAIVLRRSMMHSIDLGESTFIRIVPDDKIFSFGIGATIWQFLLRSQNKNLENFYVTVPENRRYSD
jgi:Pyridoxamine 5'-phosphate oxidase